MCHDGELGRMAWTPGQRIGQGEYQIVRELGKGGFGLTYLAHDKSGRSVVIKTPVAAILNHPQSEKLLKDFLNEALKLARCHHPHIVEVIELTREGRLDAIVMEYVEGRTLLDRVIEQGKLTESAALRYIQQVGQALTIVHGQGLLHRDIKPENIMVRSSNDEAVLIDFGIARDFMPDLTQTQTVALTRGFAPIEQYDQRAKRGAFTDIYALAATLYVLVAGELPPESQLRQIEMLTNKRDLLRAPKLINPRISDRTNMAILKGLAIKSSDRPQTMQEWLALLEPPVVIPPKPVVATPTPLPQSVPRKTIASSHVRRAISRQQFLKWMRFGGGGLVLALGGKSVIDLIAQHRPMPSSKTSTDTLKEMKLDAISFVEVTVNDKGQEIQKQPKQAKTFSDNLGDSVKIEMVSIPGGTFQMGAPNFEKNSRDDEFPQHEVTVPAFFMGRYPVTQAQYRAIMGKNPSEFFDKGEDFPVEEVSWNDAKKFCEKLSQKTGRKYRLPSEAEWEYACRAGTTTAFHFGETITSKLANYDGTRVYLSEPKGEGRKQTTAVGSFRANGFGLYDMHGNVHEWCEDVYHKSYRSAPTDGSAQTNLPAVPIGFPNEERRVYRGGNCLYPPERCRSAARHAEPIKNYDLSGQGFRVACSI